MKLFSDPNLFNYLLAILYVCNSIRWAIEKSIADVCYNVCALGIVLTITFLYKH